MSLMCPKCQTENKNDATFCRNCGETLDKEKDIKQYDGIGGWLILLGIGMFFTPFKLLKNIMELDKLKADENYESLISNYPDFVSLSNNISFISWVLFGISLYMGYLFFSKKAIFPKVFVGFMILTAFAVIYEGVATISIFHSSEVVIEFITSLIGLIIYASIWISYLFISNRSKETFKY